MTGFLKMFNRSTAMRRLVKGVFLIGLNVAAPDGYAQIYRYIDFETGSIIYTNVRPQLQPVLQHQAQRISSPVRQHVPAQADKPATKYVSSRPALTATANTRPNFPRVAATTQRERDFDRRRILNEELQSEQSALNKAVDRQAPGDVVHRHRTNVAALERELGNMR